MRRGNAANRHDFLSSPGVAAGDNPRPTRLGLHAVTPATEYILNTSLTLAGIVLLAWLLVYASRRWERAAPRGPLELLGTLRLEGKRAVYLVRVGERVVALGATEGAMIKVMELAPSEVADSAKPTEGFGALFGRLVQQPRAKSVAVPTTDASSPAASGGTGATSREYCTK
jgi:flagellar biogenesis protein FliO